MANLIVDETCHEHNETHEVLDYEVSKKHTWADATLCFASLMIHREGMSVDMIRAAMEKWQSKDGSVSFSMNVDVDDHTTWAVYYSICS